MMPSNSFGHRTARRLAGLGVLILLMRSTAVAEVEGEDASPRGTYEVVPSADLDGTDFIALAADPKQRAPLTTARESAGGRFHFSPDERWTYADYHVGSGMGSGELFRHDAGPRFVPLRPDGMFDERAWAFCVRQGAIDARLAARETGDVRIIDFVAWSPDSARLLVSLRGGVKRGSPGVYAWNLYWNARTGAFELTDYLRALNRDATRRWERDAVRAAHASAVCAEPLAPLPAVAELKEGHAAADRLLNANYAALLARLPPESQKSHRVAQREWLTLRDRGAQVYAGFGRDAAEREARRWQYLAAATRQQANDFAAEAAAKNPE